MLETKAEKQGVTKTRDSGNRIAPKHRTGTRAGTKIPGPVGPGPHCSSTGV